MKLKTYIKIFALISIAAFCGGAKEIAMNKNLTPAEKAVVFEKATERPFSGKYDKFFKDGIYVCKVCGAPLYKSDDKFDAGCGWPAFDDAFPNAVRRTPDADGRRTEISCARCGAHLGHVFTGERLTRKNVRHCVNSLSMDFVAAENLDVAIVAGGCFWGVEELMRKADGVISCVSGYTGGTVENPDYKQVCGGTTGHYEAVEIIFDKTKTTYADILKRFFEIHNSAQKDGQGNDIGAQYRSAIFCLTPAQSAIAHELVARLKSKGIDVATRILTAQKFYPAEDYHQRYYERTGKTPYCHFRRPINW